MLHVIAKVPVIRRFLFRRMRKDIEEGFSKGKNFLVLFPDQYLLPDYDCVMHAVKEWKPDCEVGFMEIHTGNAMMTVFFIADSLQCLWDGVGVFHGALSDKWLAYQTDIYRAIIENEAKRRNIRLLRTPFNA